MPSLKLLTTRWNFLFFCYQLHIFRRVDHIDTAGRSPMLWFTSSYPLPCWKWHSMNSCWPIVTGMQPIKSKIIQRVVKHKNIHCILNETVHQKCLQWMTCQRQVRLVTCWNEVQISQAFHLELRDWCKFFTCNKMVNWQLERNVQFFVSCYIINPRSYSVALSPPQSGALCTMLDLLPSMWTLPYGSLSFLQSEYICAWFTN